MRRDVMYKEEWALKFYLYYLVTNIYFHTNLLEEMLQPMIIYNISLLIFEILI